MAIIYSIFDIGEYSSQKNSYFANFSQKVHILTNFPKKAEILQIFQSENLDNWEWKIGSNFSTHHWIFFLAEYSPTEVDS